MTAPVYDTCEVCQDPAAVHIEAMPEDWWGIEAGMPADLCANCNRAHEAVLARTRRLIEEHERRAAG